MYTNDDYRALIHSTIEMPTIIRHKISECIGKACAIAMHSNRKHTAKISSFVVGIFFFLAKMRLNAAVLSLFLTLYIDIIKCVAQCSVARINGNTRDKNNQRKNAPQNQNNVWCVVQARKTKC